MHVLEGAGLGSWDWWLETNAVQFDRLWCEMLGLNPEQIEHTLSTWESRVHPDDLSAVYQDIKNYLEGRTTVYQNIHRMRHASGSWVWILDRGKVSERDTDGKPVRFTGTHFDITHYKESEILLHEIQRIAQIGGWEVDVATGKAVWTEETFRIYGLPHNTDVNKVMAINFYAAHERSRIESLVQACIQKGESYTGVFEFCDAQGNQKWVETYGQAVLDADGNIKKIRGTFQDITEFKKQEMALNQEKSKALHAAKLASLGEISAGMAHEINNPLAIISASLTLIQREISSEMKSSKYLVGMERAVRRISKIVTGLRKFSRSTDGAPFKTGHLQKIAQDAIAMTEVKSERYRVHVQLDCQATPWVWCDEIEIEQVIVNLVNNAIDACKGELNPKIQVEVLENDSFGIVRVSNPGKRIPPEVESKLFQPFFTTKPVGEGTGLGLSICKGIIDRHQGQIQLLPNAGTTCFEIRIPKPNTLSAPKEIAS